MAVAIVQSQVSVCTFIWMCLERFSIECQKYCLRVCFGRTFCDLLEKFLLLNQPMRSQAKTTFDFFTPRFPAFITGDKYLLRALIGLLRFLRLL